MQRRGLLSVLGKVVDMLVASKDRCLGFTVQKTVEFPQIMEAVLLIQERVQNRTPDQERVQNRTPVQILDVFVPQITEDSLPFVPQERVLNGVAEQIVDSPVPQIMEAGMQVSPSSPQERVQNRTLDRVPCPIVEQIRAVPVPQFRTSIVEMTQLAPPPTSRGVYWGCASAQDQGGCCGRYARGTTGAAEKAGLLGLAKRTR